MFIRVAKNRLLNLGQAYEVQYEGSQIRVWWAGELPADPDRTERAGIYDTARMAIYDIAPNDWLKFCELTGYPHDW